jgi:hypothetical protein
MFWQAPVYMLLNQEMDWGNLGQEHRFCRPVAAAIVVNSRRPLM